MGQIVKTITTFAVLVIVLATIGNLIDDPLTSSFDIALVKMFSYINYMSLLRLPVDTIFICLKIFLNFFYYVSLYYLIKLIAAPFIGRQE